MEEENFRLEKLCCRIIYDVVYSKADKVNSRKEWKRSSNAGRG